MRRVPPGLNALPGVSLRTSSTDIDIASFGSSFLGSSLGLFSSGGDCAADRGIVKTQRRQTKRSTRKETKKTRKVSERDRKTVTGKSRFTAPPTPRHSRQRPRGSVYFGFYHSAF